MAKKQFIRHLEYYGFPDQNSYASEINGIDLSDIREKNKEQDEEIKGLEGEKADNKDLIELSGTVENLIDTQDEINHLFADAISGMSDDIEELKRDDDEFAEQISAMTDSIDEILETIDELSADTNFKISEVKSAFNAYTRYANDEFAHRNNVYTKAEIDDMLSSGSTSGFVTYDWIEEQNFVTEEDLQPYATRQWVDNWTARKGFITVDSADTRYAKIDAFDDFSGQTESAITELKESLEEFSANTVEKLEELDEEVEKNTEDISALSAKVETNASNIDWCARELAKKANMSALTETRLELLNMINNLDETKADKTDIDALSGAIDSNKAAIEAEKTERRNADLALGERITDLGDRVAQAEETVRTYDSRIESVESGLTKEIADRKQADLDLIGESEDESSADTIWGAKNLAMELYNLGGQEASAYTRSLFGGLEAEFIQLSAATDSALTQFATTGYVEQRIQETLSGDSLLDDLQREITERINGDNALSGRCDELEDMYSGLSVDVSHIINKVDALTEWDGENPEEYEPWSEEHPGANGIIDIMHRELHGIGEAVTTELFARAEYDPISNKIYFYSKNGEELSSIDASEFIPGVIDNIWYDESTQELVIVWHIGSEEKETRIPIGGLIDLSDYYKKEEIDALLNEKLDVSAYTDISEQVSANTDNIEAISGKVDTVSGDVVNLDSALAALIDKLGYKNNETLVTNGEHEVAFGEYNISHNGDSTSAQTMFSVGIGTGDDDRANAIEIMKNGDVYMWVEGDYMNVNKLLGMLAHEVYDADTTNNPHIFDGE